MASLYEIAVLRWTESHDLEFMNVSKLIATSIAIIAHKNNSAFQFHFAEELF